MFHLSAYADTLETGSLLSVEWQGQSELSSMGTALLRLRHSMACGNETTLALHSLLWFRLRVSVNGSREQVEIGVQATHKFSLDICSNG
jgi:hypothetical protein